VGWGAVINDQMRIFRMFCAKYVDGPRKELFEGPNPMLTMQEQHSAASSGGAAGGV
jgi:hypothetical protein